MPSDGTNRKASANVIGYSRGHGARLEFGDGNPDAVRIRGILWKRKRDRSEEAGQRGSGTARKRDRSDARKRDGSGTEAGRKRDRSDIAGQKREQVRRAEAGQERKRDRSDIAKSGDFSACPYCQ